MFLDVTIQAGRDGDMLAFLFQHEGKRCYCCAIAGQGRPLPFAVGQQVRLEGQWSQGLPQLFEAITITATD